MAIDEDYKPRFSFEITEAQKERADRVISQYGLRKAIFGIVLDDVLDIVEEFGGMAIGAILSRNIKPKDIIPSLKQAEEASKEHGGS